MTVRVFWLQPVNESDRVSGRVNGHVKSIWGIEMPDGFVPLETFTSRRAATLYAWGKGWKVAR